MEFDASRLPVLMQNDSRLPPTSEVLDSLWIPNPSSSYHVSASMVNFEASQGENNGITPFFTQIDKEENVDEDDRCYHQPEKKRRLTVDQVQFLEKSFDVENKLEPERKVQLAKELNLQPRQVAIWFQNRRARYKTKQLEKDYDILKAIYDKLKDDCNDLQKENDKLKNEVHLLAEKLLHRDQVKAGSEQCEPNDRMRFTEPRKQFPIMNSENLPNVGMMVCKQEDANSAKSDVFDSESPHNTDGIHSSFLEPADSSHVYEPDQSDFSQDEDENPSRSRLLRPPRCPKLEQGSYIDISVNSNSLGYPVEEQSFWFWP